jgi:glucose/arabinose dehydrogenase
MSRGTYVERLESRTLFTVLASGFSETTLASGLTRPTAMDFAPDGRLFVAEQDGPVRLIKNNALVSTHVLDLPVDNAVERGVVGIVLDPSFSTNHWIYVYWTAKTPTTHNRVSRFTLNGDVADPASRVDILDLPTLTGSQGHNGGAMHFGNDGKLYVAVGENGIPTLAQDLSNPFGKVLRINKDGSIPTDNPFYNQTTGTARAIWAYGFRNPFTFGFQKSSGKMYVNDVGQDTWEEIDDVVKGGNYGWPIHEGPSNDAGYIAPVAYFQHGEGGSGPTAIVGGTFYNPSASYTKPFPSSYNNNYFYAEAVRGYVKTFDIAHPPANPTNTAPRWAQSIPYPVDIDTGPDGSIYVLSRVTGYFEATSPARVMKYTYTASNAPSIGVGPVSQTITVGGDVTFTVQASGSGLSYQWQRNDADIAGATSSSYTRNDVTLSDNGAKFRVRVSNSAGSVTSNEATLTVTTNKPPVPVISRPATGTKFIAGQPVNFAGSATDPEDGTLSTDKLTFSVSYFTGGLERPNTPEAHIDHGSFTPATITPYLLTEVFYRIYLTATDSGGLNTTTFVDVQPTLTQFTVTSNVPGIGLTLDGVPVTAPHTVDAVAGLDRPIGAPASQVLNGVTYDFVGWSDGGAASHTVSTPVAPTTYTATYQPRVSLRAVADAYVYDASGSVNTNFGSAAQLLVKNRFTGFNRESDLRFDLSSVSAASIGSVKLLLFGRLQSLEQSSVTFGVYGSSNVAWGESAITWNTRPAATTAALASATVTGTTAKWYEVDVTNYVKQQKAAGATAVSFVLKGTALKDPIIAFDSDEGANKPLLTIAPPSAPPTSTTLHAGADSYVHDSAANINANFGSSTQLLVKNRGAGFNRESDLRFDLGAVSTINSAKLRLFGRLQSLETPSVTFGVYGSSNLSWGESTVTWNNRPGTNTGVLASATVTGTTSKWYEIDLTSYLKQQKYAGASAVTLVLRGTTVADSIIQFDSDEGANKPGLIVT